MNQYEFENYIEKMKHRVKEKDYKTASIIASKIEWEKVEDINLLVFVANIYEHIKDYDSAIGLLQVAYDIAPVKNRLYYALCNINIKAKRFKEAGNYYFDFCNSFPHDPRKQVLKYYYLTARHADLEQRIRVLEEYTEEEKDEEMMYELALLYEKIDNKQKMIELCDFIVDFFGIKKNGYGNDALLLKKKHTVLTEAEEKLLEEYRFNKIEDNENGDYDSNYDISENEKLADTDSIIAKKIQEKQKEKEKNNFKDTNKVLKEDEKKTPVVLKIKRNEEQQENDKEEDNIDNNFRFMPDKDSYNKEELENVFLNDNNQKEKLKKIIENFKNEEIKKDIAKSFNKFKQNSFILKGRFETMKLEDIKLNMIIEANTKEEGIEIAKGELEYIHNVLNENVKIAKVTSYNLNDKGFSYYLQKLGTRDLIIENAGRLKDQVLDEIEEFVINKKHKNIISLVDVLNNFDKIAKERPSFIERFDVYSVFSDKEQEELETGSVMLNNNGVEHKTKDNNDDTNNQKTINNKINTESFIKNNNINEQHYEENKHLQEDESENIKVTTNEELMKKVLEKRKEQSKNITEEHNRRENTADGEMSIEEFVDFCRSYTKSIDCVLQGKTVPILYEKAEELKEDGIKLTQNAAIKLIEDAADRAEKPKLFNKPKYDKEGCLILTEDNF